MVYESNLNKLPRTVNTQMSDLVVWLYMSFESEPQLDATYSADTPLNWAANDWNHGLLNHYRNTNSRFITDNTHGNLIGDYSAPQTTTRNQAAWQFQGRGRIVDRSTRANQNLAFLSMYKTIQKSLLSRSGIYWWPCQLNDYL